MKRIVTTDITDEYGKNNLRQRSVWSVVNKVCGGL
jgi:hypothetical protein